MDLATTDRTFLRPDEVARYYAVTKRTVYNWVKHGTIPSIRVGGSIRIPVAILRQLSVRADHSVHVVVKSVPASR